MMKPRRRWLVLLAILVVGAGGFIYFIRTHPFVFNESLWEHAHCIKAAGLGLQNYASANGGQFPSHPKGYGNALLLVDEICFYALTGPGYSAEPFYEAKRTGRELSEEECGRVYIQGLKTPRNLNIVVLFDKLPTPGGDHSHFPFRLFAPLGREVLFVTGDHRFVPESDWSEFSRKQVELLVADGIERAEAERLYASKPK